MNRKSVMELKHRQVAFKAESVADDGTFEGYGSVFGVLDSYREIVAPGAFTDSLKSIKDSGDPLPVLWQHRSGEPIGGFDTLEQDARGLRAKGWLLKNEVARAAEAHALMKRRVVKGLSIGYYVEGSSLDEKTGIRTLTKLDLREISIVTFPANPESFVDAVKSAIRAKLDGGDLPTLPEFEDFLREAGFSRSQATAIAGKGLRQLLTRSESGGDIKSLLEGFTLPTLSKG